MMGRTGEMRQYERKEEEKAEECSEEVKRGRDEANKRKERKAMLSR